MTSPKIRRADTSVNENPNGSVTVAAVVPGMSGDFRHAVTFYGLSKVAAEREYRRQTNDTLAAFGIIPA